MGLFETDSSPCENTWTGRHTEKCGHPLDAEPREKPRLLEDAPSPTRQEFIDARHDGVMDMTYPQLEVAPLFDDEATESYLDDDIESGTGETYWVNL